MQLAAEEAGIEFSGGNYSGVVPPDPISNSEVKYSKADGSALARE